MRTAPLIGIVLLTATFAPVSWASTSCRTSVAEEGQYDTCTFACVPGDDIVVNANANDPEALIEISGRCGGADAECRQDGACSDRSGAAPRGGDGSCVLRIVDDPWWDNGGSGSCTASGGERAVTRHLEPFIGDRRIVVEIPDFDVINIQFLAGTGSATRCNAEGCVAVPVVCTRDEGIRCEVS